MTIENQKSQEQNQEFNAWVEAKKGITNKNAKELAADLNNIDKANPALVKQLENKLNFWDASKAWPTDKLKWTAFENSLEGKSKSEVIKLIVDLWLVSADDLKNLSWDAATKKIQEVMFDKIAQNPYANAKLQEFLKVKWLPNDGLLDGKFGARTLFALSILIDIPPATVPPTVSEKTPPVNRWSFGERLFQPESVIWMQSLTPVLADTYYFKWWMNIVFKSNNSIDETPVQPTFTIKDNWDKTEFYLGTKLITVAPKDKVPNFFSNIISLWTKSIRPHLFTENNIKKAVDNYSKGKNVEAQQYLRSGNATDADSLLKKDVSLEWATAKK